MNLVKIFFVLYLNFVLFESLMSTFSQIWPFSPIFVRFFNHFLTIFSFFCYIFFQNLAAFCCFLSIFVIFCRKPLWPLFTHFCIVFYHISSTLPRLFAIISHFCHYSPIFPAFHLFLHCPLLLFNHFCFFPLFCHFFLPLYPLFPTLNLFLIFLPLFTKFDFFSTF